MSRLDLHQITGSPNENQGEDTAEPVSKLAGLAMSGVSESVSNLRTSTRDILTSSSSSLCDTPPCARASPANLLTADEGGEAPVSSASEAPRIDAAAWLLAYLGRDIVPARVVRAAAREAGIDPRALAAAVEDHADRVRGTPIGSGPNAQRTQYLKAARTLTMQREDEARWHAILAEARSTRSGS